MNSTDKGGDRSTVADALQAATPLTLIVCSSVVGIAALFAPNLPDAVRISFAGALATGYGSAAGLGRSPNPKESSGIKQINRAENVDVNT